MKRRNPVFGCLPLFQGKIREGAERGKVEEDSRLFLGVAQRASNTSGFQLEIRFLPGVRKEGLPGLHPWVTREAPGYGPVDDWRLGREKGQYKGHPKITPFPFPYRLTPVSPASQDLHFFSHLIFSSLLTFLSTGTILSNISVFKSLPSEKILLWLSLTFYTTAHLGPLLSPKFFERSSKLINHSTATWLLLLSFHWLCFHMSSVTT